VKILVPIRAIANTLLQAKAFIGAHPLIRMATLFATVAILISMVSQSPWFGLAISVVGFMAVVVVAAFKDTSKKMDRIITEEAPR
jgi:FtsH-binding integral membrane protein